MTRGETRPSRGVGIDRSRAAAAVLVALAACAVGARAHIDPDDPDQLVHKPWEEHARPSPPPPALDHDAVLGGVYDTPLLLREDQEYELMCSVIVKPPGFMYVAPNVTINVRGNCDGADAIAWNVVNPGGSGMKPSIVILPGARLDVRGTPEKPVVIKKAGSDPSGTTRGDWGGVYMFGRARVSYGANELGQMKVGTVPGATTVSTVGLDASQKFVARHAPEATFPACDDGHGQPYCEQFQPSKDLAGDGYLDSHFRRFEYGGDDDAGSCGSLENLVVVNAGGGDSSSVTRPVALGLYGCGVATTLRNVEVAHADGVGIDLRGGAALVRDVAVWGVTSHAISASGGYRGAMRNVFVDVDGAEPVSALRVEGDLDAGEGATQYRTHPHVYSSTLVASGDDDEYYASLAATGAPPAAVATGIVSAANGAGLTLVNSIVLSRSIRRSRGVEVSGCSNEMDVGNEAAIGAPDLRGAAEATPSAARLFVSDRNVIAGFGAHPADAFGAFPTSMREVLDTTGEYHYVGSITKRREFDETWLGAIAGEPDPGKFKEVTARDWRAFGLSDGCEYKLNLADDKRPQLRSMFFPSDAPSAVDFLDPRPTELMRDAHKVDQPSKRASRGFALTTALPTTLPTTKAAIDAFLSEPVEFPGAFTLNASSVWFGPSVRTEPPAVQGATLTSAAVPEAESTRLYAHFRMFETATASSSGSTSGKRKLLSTESPSGGDLCYAPLVNVVVEQNACYRAPKWFTDKTSPSSGTARSGNFDPSTAWRAFDAFDEDETSDDDVVADVPQTLGHLLLDDAAFDSDSDSWAHGSVVAQLVADAALAAYKRGARSDGVGADIAVVRAAHVAREIPAGKFTRGDAATTLSSPDATFKVADMTGADIETLLTNGATASESSQFAYAAGARFSFDNTTRNASHFEVLADGSDREWTALNKTKTYKVILAGTETQTGTAVGGTMRDVFFEYAMSVGVLLRPPPRSRSLRELTTTSAGVNEHAFPEAAAHMKLVVQDGSDPVLLVYSSLAACESDSSGAVAAEGLFVEDPGDPCAHGEVDIVQVDILPGSIPSDNLVVTEEWTDALECPRDAETNARTPAMFTFYNASGDAPAYVFDGVQPRSAPEAEESVASGRRKLLSSSSAGAPAGMPAASGTRRALLQQAVPTSWTCPESDYGTNNGCNCNCGAPDPDCTRNGDCGNWNWPDMSSTCDMLRAKYVCSGNTESSCPTEAPYECVFVSGGSYGRRKLLDHDSSGCKMNNAQSLALDGYADCGYDSTSQTCYSYSGRWEQECASRVGDENSCYTSPDRLTDAVNRATGVNQCYSYTDSSSCNAAPGCQYDSIDSYCRITREGVETAMSDVGANEALVAYAINRRQSDICRVLSDDADSCDATAGCAYRGCYGGSSCAARDSSNCQVDNCVWTYEYDSVTGSYHSTTCTGPSGCEVHTDEYSCVWNNPNRCSWEGRCQNFVDYEPVRVAAACDSIFTAADLDLIARNGPGYDSWAQFISISSRGTVRCAANEHVQSGICVACPSGKVKAAGDDPSGPDTECYNPGIAVRDGGDVAGSPCYHILGAETGSRRGTQRFFCDASGSLTVVKWFTGSDGELKNPSCNVSAVPDEISYGAHRINFRNDLASCDAPSAFDAARSLAFAKLEGSCGSLAHAAAYARLDGRAGPFASGTRYAFPYAQRLEGAPWGCSTDDCNRARELGYKI